MPGRLCTTAVSSCLDPLYANRSFMYLLNYRGSRYLQDGRCDAIEPIIRIWSRHWWPCRCHSSNQCVPRASRFPPPSLTTMKTSPSFRSSLLSFSSTFAHILNMTGTARLPPIELPASGVSAARHQPTRAVPYNSQMCRSQGPTTPGGSPYLQTGQAALPSPVDGFAGTSIYDTGGVTAQRAGYVSLNSPTHMHNTLPPVTHNIGGGHRTIVSSSSVDPLDSYYPQAVYNPPPRPGSRAIARDLSSRDLETLIHKHQLESQRNKLEDFSKVCRGIHSCMLPPTRV